MKLDIDQERLANELDALGAISQEAPPVVTRVVFTEADIRGREFVKKLLPRNWPHRSRGCRREHIRALDGRRPSACARGHRLAHRRDSQRRPL